MPKETRLFISAGDVSGDNHASGLIREIARVHPEIRWSGLGGKALAQAGCELLEPPAEEVVMGFRRVIRRIPHYFKLLARIAEFLKAHRPRAVILVDYPGLNLRIAKIAKSLGIPVVYFICPQLWAWAPWRIGRFARRVDLALVIFPFEERYFRHHGVDAKYVGHPACDRLNGDAMEKGTEQALPEGKILGILPGSRRQEMRMNLPVMLQAAARILERHPDWIPALSHYDPALIQLADELARTHGVELKTVRGGMQQLARAAHFCMVGSGTATLEVAFSQTPMLVIYRTSKIACALAPHLLTVPYICQVNLLAGRELVPELLLERDDPAPVLEKTFPLLEEGPARTEMTRNLAEFHDRFFKPGALTRASERILEIINL